MGFLAWLRKIHYALHKCAEAIRDAEHRERLKQMPCDKPVEVRAVVSFDEKTVANTTAQNKCTNSTQRSIKNATWAAFYAVTAYAVVTAFMWCAMMEQNRIAKEQADLAWNTLERNEAASFKINDIEPQDADYWRIYVFNIGKSIAPRFDLSYSVIHQSFPDERVIDQNGPFAISRAEVLPTDPTKGADVVFDFRTAGYTQESKILLTAKETFRIKGIMSYENGFKHQVREPFCWETYPWTGVKVSWQDCNLAQSLLMKAYKANQNKTNQKNRN